jgi:uroporphyrinogen decarboxylase
MNSRERTLLALQHKPADRIPVDFWASKAMIRKLEQALGISHAQFLDWHDVDLRYIEGPRYIGPPLAPDTDIWGVKRTLVRAGWDNAPETYDEAIAYPLAGAETVDEIERYSHWPSPDWFDYGAIAAQCDAVHAAGRAAVFMGDRLNRVAQLKPAMYLRGMETVFMDMALRASLAEALFTRIRAFYGAYLAGILEAARGRIDLVLTGDDFGAQNGLLVSPCMWRAFLKEGFAAYVGLIKRHGALAMHHTCGAVAELIPDMIDGGLDVLQSLQPEARGMALPELKRRFGDRLAFHGGISIQQTMPFGTPSSIRKSVKAIADTVRSSGGYVFCTAHNIQADTPVANVVALMEAYGES